MKTKSKTQSRLFEFSTLFVMVVGTVVGGGIYMKNREIINGTQNPIIGIILWAIVGLVCVLSVVVFMEISSSTKHIGNGTVGNWTKLFVGRKMASFFSLVYVILYTPTYYALFAGSFVFYLFKLMNVRIDPSTQLTVYLCLGIFMMLVFSLLNGLKPVWSKGLQVFGTIFKFIPLLVALIVGFVMMDPNGSTSAMWNGGYDGNEWSTSSWDPALFFRGFGGILLAFDGYIYIANSQKGAKNKDVVPKALLFGMLFVALFYVLIAISLFLGSPDGSIVVLFQKLFSGGNSFDPQSVNIAANVISNVIMLIICFLNLNIFTMIGTISVDSDSEAKILYAGKRRGKVSRFKSAMVQFIVSSIMFIVFILMGFFIKTDGIHSGWNDTADVTELATSFIGIMSSVGAVLSFLMIDVLIFAAIRNRKTEKVKVDKYKGTVVLGWITGTLIAVFVIAGIYTFIDPNNMDYSTTPWAKTTAPYFLILFAIMIAITIAGYFLQEALFKKYPFEGGFEGQIEGDDPRPFTFQFNPIKNYYTKSNTKELKKLLKKKHKVENKIIYLKKVD